MKTAHISRSSTVYLLVALGIAAFAVGVVLYAVVKDEPQQSRTFNYDSIALKNSHSIKE